MKHVLFAIGLSCRFFIVMYLAAVFVQYVSQFQG